MSENRYVATILVVDDKPANIKLLFDALKGTGYRTLAALDGESAIRQAELARPDMILMDVMMPGLNGFDACRRLKANPATREIPVLFMTALADTADKLKGFQAGGVDYLTKPLQHEETLARIDAHMSRHRLWADVKTYSEILLAMGATGSLDDAWSALTSLIDQGPGVDGMALWLQQDDELRLSHSAGFSGETPDQWHRAGGTYAAIPIADRLVGAAFTTGRQIAAPDEASWDPWPRWAEHASLRSCIITPVVCREETLGVLGTFTREPVDFAFEERCRWQQILAHSLGNAIFQTRSMAEVRRLSEQLQTENDALRAEIGTRNATDGIIGSSPALRRVLDQIELVAPTDATVLILGESGTGKELLAERIHARSRRHDAACIRVNCAAIPHELFESEFFGHVKGAFTGAVKDRTGRFELANGGTLFLDEVGEIPLALQGKLLRVLQEGSFERIGEERTRTTDVRIIAATNRNLTQAVAAGRFREDLYYRLTVFPLTLPPLRDRREDIPALVQHFAAQTARKMGLPVPVIADDVLAAYRAYDWPGNIRELQNEIERGMILSGGRLPGFVSPSTATSHSTAAHPSRIIPEPEWQTMQRDNLLKALRQTAWRVDGAGGAAELLGLRPTTLRSRMKAMNLVRPV